MSRDIDTSQALSLEDQNFLAACGITAEQLADLDELSKLARMAAKAEQGADGGEDEAAQKLRDLLDRRIAAIKAMSAEDRAYLAQRDRTLEQEAERQEHAARVAETIALDEERVSAATAFVQRNGGRI